MNRREYPLVRSTTVTPAARPALPQFETLCIQDCGSPAKSWNSQNNAERTVVPYKMDANTRGTIRVTFNISFGKTRVRIFNRPYGVNTQNDPSILYDSVSVLDRGTYVENVVSDQPFLWVDFTNKENEAQGSVSVLCKTDTTVVVDADPQEYGELIDVDVDIENEETVAVRVLNNAIRRDLYIPSTLRITSTPSGSAIADVVTGDVVITAPAQAAPIQTYSVNYKIKDSYGLEHCGTVNVTATPTPVVPDTLAEANDDTAEVNENESVIIGVLDNDTSDQYATGSLRFRTYPSIGSAVINSDDTITYTAPEVGSDTQITFEYAWNDFQGEEVWATVTVNIYNTIPAYQLNNDTFRIAKGSTAPTYPLSNDNLTGLDISTFRVVSVSNSNVISVSADIPSNSISMTGSVVGTSIVTYGLTPTGGGVEETAQINVTVYENVPVIPIVLVPKLQVKNNSQVIPCGGVINFGSVEVGKYTFQNVQISNIGTSNLNLNSTTSDSSDFRVVNNSGTVFPPPVNSVYNLQVTMNTETAGNKSGNLIIQSTDPDNPTCTIRLNGGTNIVSTLPKLEVYNTARLAVQGESTTIDFGTRSIGQGGGIVLYLRNKGTAALSVTSANASSPFSSTGFSGSIPAGSYRAITLTVDDSTSGTKVGTLTIKSTDPNYPTYRIYLKCVVEAAQVTAIPDLQVIQTTGIPSPQIKAPFSIVDFGTVNVGATSTRGFILRNNGNAILNISSITYPTGYSSAGFTGAIAIGTGQSYTVTLDTSVAGTFIGNMVVNSDDPDTAAYQIRFEATVVDPAPVDNVPQEPKLIVEQQSTGGLIGCGNSVGFGSYLQNVSVQEIFLLKNVGQAVLNITNVVVSGDFTLVQSFTSAFVTPNSNLFSIIDMDTSTTGNKSGTITVTSDDPDTPSCVINLIGVVRAPAVPNIEVLRASTGLIIPNGGSVSFPTFEVGATSSDVAQGLIIYNRGDATLNVGTPTPLGDFFLSFFSPFTLAPNESRTISPSMDVSTAGSKTGTVTIGSDDPDTPSYVINLSGEVVTPTPTFPDIKVYDGSVTTELTNWVDTQGSTSSINFGTDLDKSTNYTKVVIIRNTGDSDLTISGISFDDDTYFSSNGNSSVISVGETSFFNVVFRDDTAVGLNRNTFLNINSDDPDEPLFKILVGGTVSSEPVVIGGTSDTAPKIQFYDFTQNRYSFQDLSLLQVRSNATDRNMIYMGKIRATIDQFDNVVFQTNNSLSTKVSLRNAAVYGGQSLLIDKVIFGSSKVTQPNKLIADPSRSFSVTPITAGFELTYNASESTFPTTGASFTSYDLTNGTQELTPYVQSGLEFEFFLNYEVNGADIVSEARTDKSLPYTGSFRVVTNGASSQFDPVFGKYSHKDLYFYIDVIITEI